MTLMTRERGPVLLVDDDPVNLMLTALALRERNEALESAEEMRAAVLDQISHRLRTPLNSILGYAQLLEEDEAMPAHRRQAVSVIRRGGDHLLMVNCTIDPVTGGACSDVSPAQFLGIEADAELIVNTMAKYKDFFVDVMVKEYGVANDSTAQAMESLLQEVIGRACVAY